MPVFGARSVPALMRSSSGSGAVLCWRQHHLPLDRLRRPADWGALHNLEFAAAETLATRLGLDEEQRESLGRHHIAAVDHRLAMARPTIVEPPISSGRLRRYCRPLFLNFTVGWGSGSATDRLASVIDGSDSGPSAAAGERRNRRPVSAMPTSGDLLALSEADCRSADPARARSMRHLTHSRRQGGLPMSCRRCG